MKRGALGSAANLTEDALAHTRIPYRDFFTCTPEWLDRLHDTRIYTTRIKP